ncbi:MAG TPA: lysophospholipid acyltransferase family protein [Mycobacteriales bacterium]|nr:lysophospholipid acyltransferase family protein [Mycobacteriales bacterium]
MRKAVGLRQLGFWYAVGVLILKPLAVLTAHRHWRGVEHVPASGGVIIAANHISHADPVFLAEFVVHGTGRVARFLAKSSLFEGNGLVPRVMRGAGQIPVHRETSDAALALRDAVAALDAGGCVVLYPEGTVSRDPDKWPMVAKTGVARLALLSGAPVVPVAQWGAQEILDTYRGGRLHLLPRAYVVVSAAPAVDLTRWAGREPSAAVLREVTAAVMDAVTTELEQLRGAPRPPVVYAWQGGPEQPAGPRRSA